MFLQKKIASFAKEIANFAFYPSKAIVSTSIIRSRMNIFSNIHSFLCKKERTIPHGSFLFVLFLVIGSLFTIAQLRNAVILTPFTCAERRLETHFAY
jgi:hypothetical protein